jgi:hypothetical protein
MSTQPRTCAACSAPLDRRNTSGQCKRHFAKTPSPETRAKISESRKRRFATDPAFKERQAAMARAAASSPRSRAAAVANLKRTRAWIAGNAAQPRGSESRQRAAKNAALTRLAWCPPHLLEQYRALMKKDIKHAEAKRLILEQHEVEMRRFRRSIGAEPPPPAPLGAGTKFIDRASAVAAHSANVALLWTGCMDRPVVRARWAVFLALRRAGWNWTRISNETGMGRKSIKYGVEKAEVLVAGSADFADLYRKVCAA